MKNKQLMIAIGVAAVLVVGAVWAKQVMKDQALDELSSGNGTFAEYFREQIRELSKIPPDDGKGPYIAIETVKDDELMAGGSSYLHPQGIYSFLYPNEYILDDQDPMNVRVYMRGESQRPQSEMSDGVLVNFEVLTLNGQTLEKVVDERVAQIKADGVSIVAESKIGAKMNGYWGFSYFVEGLGEFNHIVLQKDEESDYAIDIVYLVADPNGLGYQEEVNKILGTLELLK